MLLEYNLSVSTGSITAMTLSGLAAFAMLVVAIILLLKKYKAKFMPMVIGAICYFGFAYMLYMIVTAALLSIPGAREAVDKTIVTSIIRSALPLGITTFAGLYVGGKVLFGNKADERYHSVQNALIFAIGFTFVSTIYIAFNYLTYVSVAQAINETGIDGLLATMADDDGTMESMMVNMCNSSAWSFLVGGLSRVVVMVFEMAICSLIYAVMKKGLDKKWMYIACVMQVVFTFPQTIIETGYKVNWYVSLLAEVIIAAVAVVIALKFVKPLINAEIEKVTVKEEKKAFPKFDNNLKNQ